MDGGRAGVRGGSRQEVGVRRPRQPSLKPINQDRNRQFPQSPPTISTQIVLNCPFAESRGF